VHRSISPPPKTINSEINIQEHKKRPDAVVGSRGNVPYSLIYKEII
jgi:hypothetical protein